MGVEMKVRLNSKLKSHPKQNLQKSLEREYEVFCKMVVVHSLFIVTVWHYRLWNFKTRDTKLDSFFLYKNQHT